MLLRIVNTSVSGITVGKWFALLCLKWLIQTHSLLQDTSIASFQQIHDIVFKRLVANDLKMGSVFVVTNITLSSALFSLLIVVAHISSSCTVRDADSIGKTHGACHTRAHFYHTFSCVTIFSAIHNCSFSHKCC